MKKADSETNLDNVPLSGWFYLIPSLKNAWLSPLFQSIYRNNSMKSVIGSYPALVVGFILSLAASCILFGNVLNQDEIFFSITRWVVFWPGIIILGICSLSLIPPIFVGTPRHIRNILSIYTDQSISETPSTENLFDSLSLAAVLCGNRVIEASLEFVFGALAGHILAYGIFSILKSHDSLFSAFQAIDFVNVSLAMFWGLATWFLTLILINVTVCTYSLKFQQPIAILLSALHDSIFLFMSCIPSSILLLTYIVFVNAQTENSYGFLDSYAILVFILSYLMQLAFLLTGIKITRTMGIRLINIKISGKVQEID
jgi:hypothetical protein